MEQQQELQVITNVCGYFIGIMRKVAVEAMLKGWNIAQMRADDEEKHTQARLRVANAEQRDVTCEGDPGPVEGIAPVVGNPAPPAASAPERLEGMEGEGGLQEATLAAAQPQRSQTDEEAANQAHRQENEPAPQRQRLLVNHHAARQIWQSTLERIQPKISPATFTTWFTGTSGLALEDHLLIVGVRNTFSRAHLENRFFDLICSILCDLVGPAAEVEFVMVFQEEEDEWT